MTNYADQVEESNVGTISNANANRFEIPKSMLTKPLMLEQRQHHLEKLDSLDSDFMGKDINGKMLEGMRKDRL
jgi:hypothetical protein